MGPFPHDAPPATISADNPAGLDGFAFIEFAHPKPEELDRLFRTMGFAPVARHRERQVTIYRQGRVDIILNAAPGSHAGLFAAEHGPCAPSMGWHVVDPEHALRHALAHGAEPAVSGRTADWPAIRGIGGSLIYFVPRPGDGRHPYEGEFDWLSGHDPEPAGAGLFYIDHLTHNVQRGRMDFWADWYGRIFNFRQIRFFNIEGRITGLHSRAMTSPCNKIRIPINESADDKSQIEEYLREYRGEGIQHIACGCRDIYESVEALERSGLAFMPPPPETYYEKIDERLPGHGEPIDRLRRSGILIDGEAVAGGAETKVLLQIFSAPLAGPIFFEFIQRKGDEGFGEGNFRALFESIEADQIRRGVLKPEPAD
jgi:4-hydroxyphenylpyruvate dioxygenase